MLGERRDQEKPDRLTLGFSFALHSLRSRRERATWEEEHEMKGGAPPPGEGEIMNYEL
jgi:hypothetical protein